MAPAGENLGKHLANLLNGYPEPHERTDRFQKLTADSEDLQRSALSIEQLESEGLPERLTTYYELQHADVGEVAEYLEAHFSEKGGLGTQGAAGKGKKRGSLSSTLNSPSFVSFPRLNMFWRNLKQNQRFICWNPKTETGWGLFPSMPPGSIII